MAGSDQLYQCQNPRCKYIYDSEWGDRMAQIPPGTRFEDMAEDWRCPYCGTGREKFRPLPQRGE
jgi:rubredoxin